MAPGHENLGMGHGPLVPGHENLGIGHGPLVPGHKNLGMGHVQAWLIGTEILQFGAEIIEFKLGHELLDYNLPRI